MFWHTKCAVGICKCAVGFCEGAAEEKDDDDQKRSSEFPETEIMMEVKSMATKKRSPEF